jgi:hypothetical protein
MYSLVKQEDVIVCILREDEDGKTWVIPTDLSNSDYQSYLAWIADGNQASVSSE